jgi:hypothetical protein
MAFMSHFGIGMTRNKGAEAFMLRKLATLLGVDVSAIDAEEAAVAAKRRANADKRIEALKKQSNQSTNKKAKP